MTENRIVQSLWIGERLSTMEQLAIASFQQAGHEFHLYTYGDVAGVPVGTVVQDGSDILPASRIFTYRSGFGRGSYSAFSNLFRYKLLSDRGGWWVDTDVVCLRPFDFADKNVLATELLEAGRDQVIVSSSVIRQHAGSVLMQWAWERCAGIDVGTLRWGEVGPHLMQRGVDALGLHGQLRPPPVFSPVPHFSWLSLVEATSVPQLPSDAYSVHLWHQMWSHHGVDPDGTFPASSLYEQLKRRFGVSSGNPGSPRGDA